VIFRCRLGHALAQLGHPLAASAYREALAWTPDWPAKFTETAWRLATDADANHRDPEQALEMIGQVVQAVGESDARLLDVLAAGEAALGHFPEAIQAARQALAKVPSAADSALADAIRDRLRLYEQGNPIRSQGP
jgi:tetratricopeptide (TPR) repeat protein